MSRRRARWALAAAAVGAVVASAAPAGASTSTTFVVAAGSLSISEPASAALGSGAPSGTITSQLGATTVTDNRGSLLGSWTASVSASDFTTGGATANETVPKADLSYWSGAATASSGVGTFTPGQLLSINQVTLASSRTAFSAAAVVGNNSVTWNPTVIVNVPAAAVAGTYSGTITHSVA